MTRLRYPDGLKPCPYCGGSEIALADFTPFPRGAVSYHIECGACGACAGWASSQKEAKKLWNGRHDGSPS